MATDKLQAAMRHFQFCYGNSQGIVDDLFEAISDRLWALTSKSEGTFEFEVLSLREYFAAQFLYRYAGEDVRGFDRTVVFRELLRRPQWLNTARFYGGNAHGGEVVDLVDGILDELQDEPPPAARISSWTLVTDGVFQTRPRRARELVDAMVRDDEGRVVLLNALSRREVRPLPSLPDVQGDDGPDAAWARLTSELADDPEAPEARRTVRVVRELLNQRSEFAAWWSVQMAAAVGTSKERAWLLRAAEVEAAAGVTLNVEELDLGTPGTAELFLNTGALPAPGGAFEGRLLQAVLDGECPHVYSVRSMPAQVAVALRPSNFHGHSDIGFADLDESAARLRREAISKLRRTSPEFAKVAALRRFKAGQKGSTFPWSATAAALFDHAGRCWLASEIAIIGANAPLAFGGVLRPAATAFGPHGHPAELLKQTRDHATDVGWWREQLQVVTAPDGDDLARAEWTFASGRPPRGRPSRPCLTTGRRHTPVPLDLAVELCIGRWGRSLNVGSLRSVQSTRLRAPKTFRHCSTAASLRRRPRRGGQLAGDLADLLRPHRRWRLSHASKGGSRSTPCRRTSEASLRLGRSPRRCQAPRVCAMCGPNLMDVVTLGAA